MLLVAGLANFIQSSALMITLPRGPSASSQPL
jgi:hypothetical protein